MLVVEVLLQLLWCAGLKVMVECRSNSRHMLTWLMDQMDAEKDSIFLAVTKAHEQGTGMVRLRCPVQLLLLSAQNCTPASTAAET